VKAEHRDTLVALDDILRSEKVRALIQPIVERVRAELSRETAAVIQPSRKAMTRLMAWEPIPLTIYVSALPAAIKSSWVFVLRAGANTGPERHPNSHQRMMSFQGSGDMQVGGSPRFWLGERYSSERRIRPLADQQSEGRGSSEAGAAGAAPTTGKWKSNVLVSDPNAPLGKRWISIPQNVWHQPVVSKEADWVVVSFHTVPAEELIEERPEGSGSKQMRYLRS